MKSCKKVVDSYNIILTQITSNVKINSNKKPITERYRELVDYIVRLDPNAEVQVHTDDSIMLLFPETENVCAFFLVQFPGIISVEFIIAGEKSMQYEWIFADNKDSRLIFRQIINDTLNHPISKGVNPRLLKTMNLRKHPVNIDMGVNFFELTLQKSKAVIILCIAWNGMLVMDKIERASIEGKFEILFFNCMLIMNYLDNSKIELSGIQNDLIRLLIFYLEKHQLVKHFDLELLINQRIDFYGNVVKEMETMSRSTCYALYYYFYIKPLYRKTNLSLLPIEHNMISNLMLMNENIRKKVVLYLS